MAQTKPKANAKKAPAKKAPAKKPASSEKVDAKKIVEKANNVYEEIPKTLGLKPYKREYYLLFLYTIFAYMAEFMDEDNQKLEKIIEMLKSEIEYSSRDLDEKFVMERIFGYASSENKEALCLLWQDSLKLLEKEEGLDTLEELVTGLEKIS